MFLQYYMYSGSCGSNFQLHNINTPYIESVSKHVSVIHNNCDVQAAHSLYLFVDTLTTFNTEQILTIVTLAVSDYSCMYGVLTILYSVYIYFIFSCPN